MIKIVIIVLVTMFFVLTFGAIASQHTHKMDMQRLMEFCKMHSKKECHELQAKIHMKYHGGTNKDFQNHYEEEHIKENGEMNMKSH